MTTYDLINEELRMFISAFEFTDTQAIAFIDKRTAALQNRFDPRAEVELQILEKITEEILSGTFR